MTRGFVVSPLRWALLLGLAMPAFGCAGGERPAVGQVRRVTPTATDSECVGDPKTPLCALDTFQACLVRYDNGLCFEIGLHPDTADEDLIFGFSGESEFPYPFDRQAIEYRVVQIDEIQPDLSVIYATTRECGLEAGQPSCTGWTRMYYVAWWNPLDDEWRMASWGPAVWPARTGD